MALIGAACGGDDDDSADSTTTTVAVTVAPTTVAPTTPPTTAAPAPTTTLALVTDGATVIVANASGINGAAGRMSDAIAIAGFSTGDATNSSETVGQLETSQIYFEPEDAAAEAVANSLKSALGGGDIELLDLGVPAPTESGDVGDATVLLLMGNDVADKSLAELQGLVEPEPETESTDETDESDESDETTDDG